MPIISCLAPLGVQCPIGSIKFRLSFCLAFNLYYVRPVIIFSLGYITCYIITLGFKKFYVSIPVLESPNYDQVQIKESSNMLIMYLGASPILALKESHPFRGPLYRRCRGHHMPLCPQLVCSRTGIHSPLGPAPGSTHLTDGSLAKAPIRRVSGSLSRHQGLLGI